MLREQQITITRTSCAVIIMQHLRLSFLFAAIYSMLCSVVAYEARAEDSQQDSAIETEFQPLKVEEKWPFKDPDKAIRLTRKGRVWIDTKKKTVFVDGVICLREGQLEMFACPEGIKEHESIVSARARPRDVHAGLLAVGAIAGHPVKFRPKYIPAKGTEIEIFVQFYDKKGKLRQVNSQTWVKNVKTQKALKHSWVFGGSGFWTDEENGKKYYMADSGDFICVSNFSTAMLDLPISSSQATGELLYEAFTKQIPPVGTKVRLILKPKLKKKSEKPEKKTNDRKQKNQANGQTKGKSK